MSKDKKKKRRESTLSGSDEKLPILRIRTTEYFRTVLLYKMLLIRQKIITYSTFFTNAKPMWPDSSPLYNRCNGRVRLVDDSRGVFSDDSYVVSLQSIVTQCTVSGREEIPSARVTEIAKHEHDIEFAHAFLPETGRFPRCAPGPRSIGERGHLVHG